jgi:hypothetical protein
MVNLESYFYGYPKKKNESIEPEFRTESLNGGCLLFKPFKFGNKRLVELYRAAGTNDSETQQANIKTRPKQQVN